MKSLKHIAFIMDGNRRWAKSRHLPPNLGHKNGLKAMKEIANFCVSQKIPGVSFYVFSLENWNRSNEEISFLMDLINNEIASKNLISWLDKHNVRFVWNGFTDNLPINLVNNILHIVEHTKNHSGMKMQIMFNYGSQQKIVWCANQLLNKSVPITVDNFQKELDPAELGPVDLLIRTSGESRLSNFMLFELSYAEIIFNPNYWPDYNSELFKKDIDKYYQRERRFGN